MRLESKTVVFRSPLRLGWVRQRQWAEHCPWTVRAHRAAPGPVCLSGRSGRLSGQRCGAGANRAAALLRAPCSSGPPPLSLSLSLSRPLPEPRQAPEPAAPAAPPSSALGGGAASVSRRSGGGDSPLLPWEQLPRSRSALSAPPALPSLRAGHGSFPRPHPSTPESRNRTQTLSRFFLCLG